MYEVNERVIKLWRNELVKAHEELIRSVERAKSHAEDIVRYTTAERVSGMSARSDDPVEVVVTARRELEKIERLCEQTFWLLGMEADLIEALKAEGKMNVSDRYKYFYAEA